VGGWTPAPPPPTFVSPAPAPALPGGVPSAFELASWGSRLGAYLLDGLIRFVLALAIAALGFTLLADQPFSFEVDDWTETGAFTAEDDPSTIDGEVFGRNNLIWMLATAFGIYFLLALLYAPLFMAMWRGATPGKRICGIRVVRENGANIDFGMAFVREALVKGFLMNVVASSFFLPWLANYLWPLWDRECRAGHDLIVRTRVVKAPRA
jgi:uncharacterized RDD family membrane protein YckC